MSTLLPWYLSRDETTLFERSLRRCPDFLHACRRLAAHCLQTGGRLISQCEREGVPYDADFWREAAHEAQDVAELIETLQAQHPNDWKPRALDVLRRAKLCSFVYALEEDTGEAYARELGF